MGLQYRPCKGYNGQPCHMTTWRTNPQLCKRCLKLAQRAGQVPPAGARPAGPPPPPPPGAPPPPRPRGPVFAPVASPKDLALTAMAALEAALKAKVTAPGAVNTPELKDAFEKYTKIKGHVLNNAGPEQEVALRMALARLVNMVF